MVVVKRQHIVVAALVVLVGAAGYINWTYQGKPVADTQVTYVEDGETQAVKDQAKASTPPVEAAETNKKLGEAKYVNSNASSQGDFFVEAKMQKDTARSKALEVLNKNAQNQSFDAAARKTAQDAVIAIGKNIEKEALIENVAKAKGYQASVFINEGVATLTVKANGLTSADIAKLKDIIVSNSNITSKNIKIVEVK